MRDDLLKGLSEEQIKKLNACNSSEEILTLAKDEGVELTNEQLEAISGGACHFQKITCPYCGSDSVHKTMIEGSEAYDCWSCNERFIP